MIVTTQNVATRAATTSTAAHHLTTHGAATAPHAAPSVTVRYFAAAAEAAGRDEERIPIEGSLGDLRDELLRRYGDPMARVLRSGSFLVDGKVSRDTDRPLGDTVDILPPFAGG